MAARFIPEGMSRSSGGHCSKLCSNVLPIRLRGRGEAVQGDTHLLNGLIFDETGDGPSPVHAAKGGKHYRSYISARLKDGKAGNKDGWRIPAVEIEAIVLQ